MRDDYPTKNRTFGASFRLPIHWAFDQGLYGDVHDFSMVKHSKAFSKLVMKHFNAIRIQLE